MIATAPPHAVLEAARIQAGMSFQELWITYFSLGGSAQPDMVRAYLGGSPIESGTEASAGITSLSVCEPATS
jgi:hypothetical protein